MTTQLAGVRVVEVATHVFVPIAGAVMAEWGAEVVKIEHPATGDPTRGVVTAGLEKMNDGADPYFHIPNRGKRSVAIDIKHPEGRRALAKLVANCDVFLTSFRAGARKRLGIDVEDIRADNPSVIYARGTGFGIHGPDANRGGFDSGVYWGRSGMQHIFTPPGGLPAGPRAAFGDAVGGVTLAGAISTALYHRATTGEPSVVDASLLASGLWQIQYDVISAKLAAQQRRAPVGAPVDRYQSANPLMLPYLTADGRYIILMMLAPDEYWTSFCKTIGHPELADDPRYRDLNLRRQNSRACIQRLEAIFAQHDLAEWRRILDGFDGQWTPMQTPGEAAIDPQVIANGYIADVEMLDGEVLPMVTSPIQFDEQPNQPTRGPEHGEHTDTVLLEAGLSWDEIMNLKIANAIL
jgi:crotonobetainyl-CoA:carnitine CoA-transferase CaiB-like acyl-CoA transferase